MTQSAQARATGKIILCGEHAVVYSRPAIALPLSSVGAQAYVRAGPLGAGMVFDAPDLGQSWSLIEQPEHPLSALAVRVLEQMRLQPTLDLHISVRSSIPIASGMGSGAAIAAAIARALSAYVGHPLSAATISELVYASERYFHGTPSGIDNTVIAFEQPIWFVRTPAQPLIEPIGIAAPLTLLIGDSGVRSPTYLPVGSVRERWLADPARYEALFDAVAERVVLARAALGRGDLPGLGALLDENHRLLMEIGVSSLELDRLVAAARDAGALGAKLSGAGWGGVMIALVSPETQEQVAAALREAGAASVLPTTIAAYATS